MKNWYSKIRVKLIYKVAILTAFIATTQTKEALLKLGFNSVFKCA